jgi:hypothetical protein
MLSFRQCKMQRFNAARMALMKSCAGFPNKVSAHSPHTARRLAEAGLSSPCTKKNKKN